MVARERITSKIDAILAESRFEIDDIIRGDTIESVLKSDTPAIDAVLAIEPSRDTKRIIEKILTEKSISERVLEETASSIASVPITRVSEATKWEVSKTMVRAQVLVLTVATAVAIVIGLYSAPSWWVFLKIVAFSAGDAGIPSFLVGILKSMGITIASGLTINALLTLARKNPALKKALAIKLNPKFVSQIVKNLGVKNVDLTIESFMRALLNTYVQASTGTLPRYLIGQTISATISYAPELTRQAKDIVKRRVIDSLFAGRKWGEIITDVEKDIGSLSTERALVERETADVVVNTISSGKLLAGATATATALLAVAVSSDVASLAVNLPSIPIDALDASKFITENKVAISFIGNILTSRGITNVISLLGGDKLFSSRLEKRYREGAIKVFLREALGEKVYTLEELKTKSIDELKSLASTLGISISLRKRDDIAKVIYDALQSRRRTLLSILVQHLMTTSIAVGASIATTSLIEHISLPEIDRERIALEKSLADAREAEATVIEESKRARLVAREKVAKFKEEHALKDAIRSATEKIAFEEAKARKVLARTLLEAGRAHDLAQMADIFIARETGEATAVPSANVLLHPDLQKVLDKEFTPFMVALTKETLKSSTHFIPGIGLVASAIDKINVGLAVAETAKDVGEIVNVVLKLQGREGFDMPKGIDSLLSKRVPSLDKAIDDLISVNRVNAKIVVLDALRNKIVYGWDNERTAAEITSKFIWGADESLRATEPGLLATTSVSIGMKIWNKVFS